MTFQEYVYPKFQETWFNCPKCKAFSQQVWNKLYGRENWIIYTATCKRCDCLSIWYWEDVLSSYDGLYSNSANMIFPSVTSIPSPSEDLEVEIQEDYLEAASIVDSSPRGACALLRFALQKLMIQLWESGKDINKDIWSLVKKWLNPIVQQALDTVRVIGNEAVHPWELNIKDDKETAYQIFWLINIISDYMITQPRKIQELYWTLPTVKLQGIQDRDS